MGNGSTVGRLLRRSIHVQVDPLMIPRRVGKQLHALLCDRKPIGNGKLLPNTAIEFI